MLTILKLLKSPWIILGCITAALTVYFYGHHVGYALRDLEMQSEISAKNEEARERESAVRAGIDEHDAVARQPHDALGPFLAGLRQRIQRHDLVDHAVGQRGLRVPNIRHQQQLGGGFFLQFRDVGDLGGFERARLLAAVALVLGTTLATRVGKSRIARSRSAAGVTSIPLPRRAKMTPNRSNS